MNPHFSNPPRAYNVPIPQLAYGRLDHVELSDSTPVLVLMAFDLIDENWLRKKGQRDKRFGLTNPHALKQAWGARFGSIAPGPLVNPFEDAPLYRLEVVLPIDDDFFGLTSLPNPNDEDDFRGALAALESTWFEFRLSSIGEYRIFGKLYPGLFAEPATVTVTGSLPSMKTSEMLSIIFSLSHIPKISTQDLQILLAPVEATTLAVYDVGQGNSNALCGACPSLYYDLGAGVYRNKHTTPPSLQFCFCTAPTIVLSHWDADHWAGAYVAQANGALNALNLTWITPLQPVGPTHIAFAYDVMVNGHIFTYATAGVASSNINAPKGKIHFALGNGRDRNGTGIVFAIENHAITPMRSWILTGDCDYRFFTSQLTISQPVAMVAPHHGAGLSQATQVPRPMRNSTYLRILYSFGPGNAHGRNGVSHPTPKGVLAHSNVGWNHGKWNLQNLGQIPPGPDVIATSTHGAAPTRGGGLIGWSAVPKLARPACGCGTTTYPTQT